MRQQLHQIQYIINKIFNEGNGTLRTTNKMSSTQECLNAIYDDGKGALKINLEGGMKQILSSSDELPSTGKDGDVYPVVSGNKIDFYRWNDGWELLGMNQNSDETDSTCWVRYE